MGRKTWFLAAMLCIAGCSDAPSTDSDGGPTQDSALTGDSSAETAPGDSGQSNQDGAPVDDASSTPDGTCVDPTPSTHTPPPTTGAQTALIILVDFQDNNEPRPYTTAQVQNLIFTQANAFFQELSYGKMWLEGDVTGWHTIQQSKSVCDMKTTTQLALAAALAAGYDANNYDNWTMIVADNACPPLGSGTSRKLGNPTKILMNSISANTIWYSPLGTFTHEFGHTLGLPHSHALKCNAGPISGTCTHVEYGDAADTMGRAQGHFNAYKKQVLGWLDAPGTPPITHVTTNGTYHIGPYEAQTMTAKALRIPKTQLPPGSTARGTDYYVEYRTASGADAYMHAYPNLTGLIIHRVSNGSHLLGMGSDPNMKDAALQVGESFVDSGAGITISFVSADDNGADIQVSFGSQGCIRANPEVTLTPNSGNICTTSGGTTESYTVTIKSNDTAACEAAEFSVAGGLIAEGAPVPGWTTSLSQGAVTLLPGQSQNVTMTLSSPASAALGSYSIRALATSTLDASLKTTTFDPWLIRCSCP